MQIRRIWGFQETHETRTPKHSKSEEGRPLSCQALVRTAGGFFVLSTVHIGAYAYFVPQSLKLQGLRGFIFLRQNFLSRIFTYVLRVVFSLVKTASILTAPMV